MSTNLSLKVNLCRSHVLTQPQRHYSDVRRNCKNKFVYAYEKLTKVSCKREINNLYEDNETLNPSNKFIKSSRYYIITTNYF